MDITKFISAFGSFLEMGFTGQNIATSKLVSTQLILLVLSLYMFFLYRFTTKKVFYSKYFNITIAVIPFLIATIIMTLQSSLLITLGTVGALAIIRYRTAIKDPMDMLYLFWAVQNGIVCGSGLYRIAVITSIVVSVLILVLDRVPISKAPYLFVANSCDKKTADDVLSVLKSHTSYHKVKSRNFTKSGIDMIVELRTKDENILMEKLMEMNALEKFSLISHDGETIV